jgi:hypothetical protein
VEGEDSEEGVGVDEEEGSNNLKITVAPTDGGVG